MDGLVWAAAGCSPRRPALYRATAGRPAKQDRQIISQGGNRLRMPFPLLILDRIRELKEEGRREGLEEARQEIRQQWMAWYERQQAAFRTGQPFTEPPPASPPAKQERRTISQRDNRPPTSSPLLIPDRIRELKEQGRQEGRKQRYEEGLKQGRQENHQQWMAWYERQQAAQRDGQPFTEPPPAGPPSRNGK